MSCSFLCVATVAVLVFALAEAWPGTYDNEFKRWSLSRRSFGCKESGGKCYSTGDCCKSYVCAAFDEYGQDPTSLNPTTPGWCVHEKELQPCVSSLDCDTGKCVSLGTHRYCVAGRPKTLQTAEDLMIGAKYGNAQPKGGLSSVCEDDSECHAYSGNGVHKLCCQKIRMGRQGTKQRCDKITAISVCISKRK